MDYRVVRPPRFAPMVILGWLWVPHRPHISRFGWCIFDAGLNGPSGLSGGVFVSCSICVLGGCICAWIVRYHSITDLTQPFITVVHFVAGGDTQLVHLSSVECG